MVASKLDQEVEFQLDTLARIWISSPFTVFLVFHLPGRRAEIISIGISSIARVVIPLSITLVKFPTVIEYNFGIYLYFCDSLKQIYWEVEEGATKDSGNKKLISIQIRKVSQMNLILAKGLAEEFPIVYQLSFTLGNSSRSDVLSIDYTPPHLLRDLLGRIKY